jgi:hypothetical protein
VQSPWTTALANKCCKVTLIDSEQWSAYFLFMDIWGSRVRFPVWAGNFYLQHRVQNGSGAHPASYLMGARGPFPGVKRPGCEMTTHLHLIPRLESEWRYTFTLQYAFMAWCSVKKSTGTILPLPLPKDLVSHDYVSSPSSSLSFSWRTTITIKWNIRHTRIT